MSIFPEPRQQFQFSLRQLMLWTMVVALYLGVIVFFQVDLILVAVLTVWLVVVGTLRIAFDRRIGCLVSVMVGVLLLGWFTWVGLLCGIVFGLIFFLIDSFSS
jgi:hypothetical protein